MSAPTPVGSRVLVLGGGGITGIAWEVGLLAGLAEAGVDLSDADTVIGTSAGSVVGAQLTSGVGLPDLYERQLAGYGAEVAAKIGTGTRLRYAVALLRGRDGFRQRLGTLARKADVMPERERLEIIAARLPTSDWPAADLRLTAVDAVSGEFSVLDRDSGADLVSAVAASCAVPGVYPAITVLGRPMIDGGVQSVCNADLAAGAAAVVVLAPMPRGVGPMTSAAEQVDALRAAGTRVVLVSPDPAAVAAIGRNPLDPARRAGSAAAGRAQAAQVRAEVAAVWSG